MDTLATFDDIVDRLVDWATEKEILRALWLEGESLTAVRRPYPGLEVHLCADEPAYPQLFAALEDDLKSVVGANVVEVADTQRFAKWLDCQIGDLKFAVIAEQSHLLAKRPRAEVIPLVDKTGHLPHVLNYSLRRR